MASKSIRKIASLSATIMTSKKCVNFQKMTKITVCGFVVENIYTAINSS